MDSWLLSFPLRYKKKRQTEGSNWRGSEIEDWQPILHWKKKPVVSAQEVASHGYVQKINPTESSKNSKDCISSLLFHFYFSDLGMRTEEFA